MKKFYAFASLLLFILCGCYETAVINGVEYQVLSDREEKTLIAMAKDSLKRSENALSPRDHYMCMAMEPKLEIKYMDNRSGQAKIIWQLEDKNVIIGIAGEFLTEDVQWIMYTEPRDTTIVDGRTSPKKGRK